MPEGRKLKVRTHAASRHRILEGNFVDSIRELRGANGIDLVCFTGDVADWGLGEEYDLATKRIDAILAAAGVGRDRFFAVPGNHDVNRKRGKTAHTGTFQLAASDQAGLSRWMAGAKPPFGADKLWRAGILRRTAAFWHWVTAEMGRADLDPKANPHGRLGYRVSLDLGYPVHIVGLDSAWLCGSEDDQGKLLLTAAQVDMLTTNDGGAPLDGFRLALVHHPLSWLADERDARLRLAERVDLVLHGHQHTPAVTHHVEPGHESRVIAAGCLYEGDEGDRWSSEYHLIEVELNDETRPLVYGIHFGAWSDGAGWHKASGLYRGTDSGYLRWPTKLGEAEEVRKQIELHPQPKRVFVSREAELAALKAALLPAESAEGAPRVCAVHGMAGVGKSWLVEHFTGTHVAEFAGGELRLALEPGGSPPANDLIRQLERARQTPEATLASALRATDTLVHVENVDDPACAEVAAELVRRLPGAAIAITGRYAGLKLRDDWSPMEIRSFDESTGVLQLETEIAHGGGTAAHPGDDTMRQLASELGGLPLALHIAAGYLRMDYPVDAFLRELRERRLELGPLDPAGDTDAERARRNIGLTLGLSLDALSLRWSDRGRPRLGRLLALGIAPRAGFGQDLAASTMGVDEVEASAILADAASFHLAEPVPGADRHIATWQLHPLVAEYFDGRLGDGNRADAWLRLSAWLLSHPGRGLPRLTSSGFGAQLARRIAETCSLDSAQPIVQALSAPDAPTARAAETILESATAAPFIDPAMAPTPPVGESAPPWCALARAIAEGGSDDQIASDMLERLLYNLCEHSEGMTDGQRGDVNAAGRAVAGAAIRQPKALRCAAATLAKTCSADPAGTERALRELLSEEREPAARSQALGWISVQVEHLLALPDLVLRLYKGVFGPGGTGATALTGDYHLAQVFPDFLRRHPAQATRALSCVVEGFLTRRESSEPGPAVAFDLLGTAAGICRDGSCIWDATPASPGEYHLQMLDAFEEYLVEIGTDPADEDLRTRVVHAVAESNRWAAVWRRLLRAGAACPEALGKGIRGLLLAEPVLTSTDAFHDACRLLASVHPFMPDDERERLERIVVSWRGEAVGGLIEDALCRRYLRCLHPDAIVTDEARKAREELVGDSPPDPGEPLFGPIVFTVEDTSPETLLAEARGREATGDEEHLGALRSRLEAFCQRYAHASPSLDEARAIAGDLRESLRTLRDESQLYSQADSDRTAHWLAETCTVIARSAVPAEPDAGPIGDLITDGLIWAAESPAPRRDQQVGERWDDHPGWGHPCPRVVAAEGLTAAARFPSLAPRVIEAVTRLAEDPRPEVRYNIASRADLLFRTANDRMWDLLRRLSLDVRPAVAAAAVGRALLRIALSAPDEAAHIALRAYAQARGASPPHERLLEACASVMCGLAVVKAHVACREELETAVADPLGHPTEAEVIAKLASTYVADPDEVVARRAADLLQPLLSSAAKSVGAEHLVHVCAVAAAGISGQAARLVGEDRAVDSARRLLALAGPLLLDCASAGGHAASLVIDALLELLPADPGAVLELAARAVKESPPGSGIAYMVPDKATRLVERAIDDHAEALKPHSEACGSAESILECALSAGCTRAALVAQRLAEVR